MENNANPVRSEHSQRNNLSSKSAHSLLDASNGAKPTIIVVDDDPMIGRCLTMFLDGRSDAHERSAPNEASGQGYRVIFFTNGNKALAYLADNTVHFLLTDLQMPEMTGLELLRQVKTLYPTLPALVMSGTANGPDRDEIFALGADFIAKPFELADLLGRIQCKLIKERSGFNIEGDRRPVRSDG